MRADAQRNRDALVDVAVRAFSHDGPDVTLDAIAREAGVGIGTLYRHFPSREALVEAAYRNELTRLCEGVAELLDSSSAEIAMREWMDRFVDYMTTKRGMGDALKSLIAAGGDPFADSYERLTTAINSLLGAGITEGALRSDVSAADLLAGLGGISLAAGEPGLRAQAGRLLDLLMDGLRARN
jgi:AcrR family transcriptional regulator